MSSYKYLIIGGGMTTAAAINGIRETDADGSIGVISTESHRPYDRPPLTKGLWKDAARDSIWRKLDAQKVTFHLERTARSLDLAARQIKDDRGNIYQYEKLLLATGCTPRQLPFGDDQIIYFRTLDDYDRLRELTRKGNHFAVIGGGFIGSELAAALTMNGKKVTHILPESAIGSRIFPAEFAKFITGYYRDKGVEVLTESKVIGCESKSGKSVLKYQDNKGNEQQLIVDGIVAGIGVQPNVDLAKSAGLTVNDGIRVDTALRTSHADVFAAGDVASFHNPALNRYLRVEHEDNANTMGKQAGISMAGGSASYDHLPFFYSDLFEMGYEAVGETDGRYETFIDWHDEKNKVGVFYYLKDGHVRGALMCNLFGKVDEARALIAKKNKVTATDLRGAIK